MDKIIELGKSDIKIQGYRATRYLCPCGKEFVCLAYYVKKKIRKSCGCRYNFKSNFLGKKSWNSHKDTTLSSFNSYYGLYKNSARKRNLLFDLSKEQFRTITQMNCHYCNRPPDTVHHKGGSAGSYVSNGVDRKDNSLGYVEKNCLSCCTLCNRLKSNKGYDEFISIIHTISDNFRVDREVK